MELNTLDFEYQEYIRCYKKFKEDFYSNTKSIVDEICRLEARQRIQLIFNNNMEFVGREIIWDKYDKEYSEHLYQLLTKYKEIAAESSGINKCLYKPNGQ